MVEPNYTAEKLFKATNALVAGDGSLAERMKTAAIDGRTFPVPNEGSVPDELRDRVQALHDAITAVEPKGEEGSIYATIDAMDEQELAELATKVFEVTLDFWIETDRR